MRGGRRRERVRTAAREQPRKLAGAWPAGRLETHRLGRGAGGAAPPLAARALARTGADDAANAARETTKRLIEQTSRKRSV